MGCNNSKDKKEPEASKTAANPMNSPSTAAGNQQQASAFPEMKRDVNAPGPMNRKRSNAGAAGGRGKNVYGQKTEDIQGYVKPDIPAKSEVERSSLRATIAQIEEYIDNCVPVQIQAGESLSFTPYELSGNLYLITEDSSFQGEAVATGHPVENMGVLANTFFGFMMGACHNIPGVQEVKVNAFQSGQVYKLPERAVRLCKLHVAEATQKETEDFLREVALLEALTDDDRSKAAAALSTRTFKAGEHIIRQGEVGDAFYIIASGEVKCTKTKNKGLANESHQELVRLGRQAYFGERALLDEDVKRQANVIALEETKCLSLSREDFKNILGPLKDKIQSNKILMTMQSVKVLQSLSEIQRHAVMENLDYQTFKKGSKVITQGDSGDLFFIIVEGRALVSIMSNGLMSNVAQLESGQYFGETALIQNDVRNATVTANSASLRCAVISRENFQKHIMASTELAETTEKRRALNLKIKSGEYKAEFGDDGEAALAELDLAEEVEPDPLASRPKIAFDDLNLDVTLGVGTFGRVKLAKHTPTGTTYALKCLSLQTVDEMKQKKNIMNEKGVMEEMYGHPFVPKLLATYKDDCQLYMLQELLLGGELFSILASPLPEARARFYAAQVVLVFEAMQKKGWVYRDLKPENILVDKDGYIKVIDYGFAKHLGKDAGQAVVTYTQCGTPEYMSPEVVSGDGHHKGADWWAFGILIYECINGNPPFFSENPFATYKQIMAYKNDVKFPAGNKNFSPDVQDLIRKLLKKNPQLRLGCLLGGAEDVKKHKWFEGIDWDELQARRFRGIDKDWVPELKGDDDTSKFDHYDDDEDGLMPYRGKKDWYENWC